MLSASCLIFFARRAAEGRARSSALRRAIAATGIGPALFVRKAIPDRA